MGATLFVAGNLSALFVADSIAVLTMSGREPWRRWLATLAGFPLVVLAVVLILGATGYLRAGYATCAVASAALVLAGLRLRRFRRGRLVRPGDDRCEERGKRESTSPADRPFLAFAIVLLGVHAGVTVLTSCLLGTEFFSDDLSFHATVPAHWLADGAFSLVPFSWHAYHPYNAETLAFWFVLPFAADAYASLAGLYWYALALGALLACGRIQAHATSTISMTLALFAALPAVDFQTRTFSAVDLAAVAAALAAVPFAISQTATASPGARRADAAYCGLLAGFATGCKVSFAPVVAILLFWWLTGARSAPRLGARLGHAAVFTAGVIAAGCFWYVRALLVTGNPLFPAELGPFEGPLTSEIAQHTRLLAWVLNAPDDLEQWLFLLRRHLDWPLGMALLPILGFALTLRETKLRAASRTSASDLRFLLVSIGVTLLVLYPLMPMSGAGHGESQTLRVSLRYALAPFVFGLALFPALLEPQRRARLLWWSVALVAAVTSWPGLSGRRPFVAVVTGLGALALARAYARFESSVSAGMRTSLAAAAATIALALLAAWSPYKQRATDRNLYEYAVDHRSVGGGWHALEELPAGARVAAFESSSDGIDHTSAFFYYPAFGRRLSLTPIFVEPDGSPGVPLHARWAADRTTLWDDLGPWDLSRLVANLAANRIDHVLVSKLGEADWPPQYHALMSSPHARSLHDDGEVALFALAPTEK